MSSIAPSLPMSLVPLCFEVRPFWPEPWCRGIYHGAGSALCSCGWSCPKHRLFEPMCEDLNGVLVRRGFVYCRNEELEPGWVVFSSGRLLHRPSSFDAKPYQLCQVVDPFTLQVRLLCPPPHWCHWNSDAPLRPPQVSQIVPMPAHHLPVGSSMTTLHLCSDGTYLYWVWSPAGLNEKTQKGHSVFMDVFCLSVSRQ